MAEDVLLAKKGSGLFPTDADSAEALEKIKSGEVVRCEIVRPRNARHHRLAMALLQEVFKHVQDFNTYPSFKIFYDNLKVGVGCCDWYKTPEGHEYAVPRSWAWHMMGQEEFQQNWDVVLKYITTRLLPGVSNADLEKRVYQILGGPWPEDV